jgi:Protein phosphatase 2C
MAWRAIAHSSIGVSHYKRGGVCQDYADFITTNNDFVVGAVSDGAGSAKFSDIGSELAVKTTLKYLVKHSRGLRELSSDIPEDRVREIFERALEEVLSILNQNAKERRCRLADMACTLLAFISTPKWIAAMQIGDGFIVIKPKNETYQLLFQPDKGEYSNETTFITSSCALNQMQILVVPVEQDFICASTDGLERLAIRINDWTAPAGFFEPLESYIKSEDELRDNPNYVKDFLQSDKLNTRTDDDKTLLLCIYDKKIHAKDQFSIPGSRSSTLETSQGIPVQPDPVVNNSPNVPIPSSPFPQRLISDNRSSLPPILPQILFQNFTWNILAGLFSGLLFYTLIDSTAAQFFALLFPLKVGLEAFLILIFAMFLAGIWSFYRGSWIGKLAWFTCLFIPTGYLCKLLAFRTTKVEYGPNITITITLDALISLALPVIVAIIMGSTIAMSMKRVPVSDKKFFFYRTALVSVLGFTVGWLPFFFLSLLRLLTHVK